jgi:DNA-binding transcriptional MocR family regulator
MSERPAYQQIADDISKRISDGSLRPGQKLPSEPELMAQYQVSRIVVRQALGGLRQRGAIVTNQGRGSFVQPPPSLEDTNGWRCACGCQTPVSANRVYAPGHDARHRDRLVDLLVGRGSVRSRATRIQHLIAGLEARA